MTVSSNQKRSVAILLALNSISLFGVLFFNWSIATIMILFWAENIVIGVFNVLRMLQSIGTPPESQAIKINDTPYTPRIKFPLIVFFVVHYGVFTAVHGALVFSLFAAEHAVDGRAIAIGIGTLFVSHGASHLINFMGTGEYTRVTAGKLFLQPYKRVFILHLVLLFGGFLVTLTEEPLTALILLIVVKAIVDAFLHLIEHNSFNKLTNS